RRPRLDPLREAGAPNLETTDYQTTSAYDALNRVTLLTLPEDVNTTRKDITPSYNRAGALEKVHFDGVNYVEHIAYNAKGQRLLIAMGNEMMTRYAYDPKTFRLSRQKTEKYAISTSGNEVTYTPQSGTTKQDNGYEFDLIGNILKIKHRTTDCGINGTTAGDDALDRLFSYDPLNRLLSATGRESDTQNDQDYLYTQAPTPGSPNANNVREYSRDYQYDKLGNITSLTQAGSNGFTRNFVYGGGVNTLDEIQDSGSSPIQDFTYDSAGNQLTAGTTRNMVWDHSDRMIVYYNQVGTNEPTIYAQYLYDSAGNRTHKLVRTTGGLYETTVYIDGVFEYHTKDEGGSTKTKNYTHIMDDQTRVATIRTVISPSDVFNDDIGDDIYYILTDQIGSGTERLNTSGTVIDKEEYYPFGDSSLRTFTKKRYQYVGKEKDSESGLYYYGARYYAAWTCRFISVDPLASKFADLSPYNYAGNKPINKVDIDGLQEDGRQGTPSGGDNTPPEVQAMQSQNIVMEVLHSLAETYSAAKESLSNSLSSIFSFGNSESATNIEAGGNEVAEQKTEAAKSDTTKGDTSKPDYNAMAKELGVDKNVLKAIASVESSGSGFTEDGKPVVRFEGHKFKKYLKENGFDVAKLEKENPDLIYGYSESKSKNHGYSEYEKAMKIDPESAMMATSYGAFQIMGFNYEAAGFDSVEAFAKAQSTTAGQVKGFINFAKSNSKRLQAMKDKNFSEFARLYNGEDYAEWKYDTKMQNAYNKLIGK
ncbi:MAG: DUF3380 domain-containing protein, partial [Flavobacteriales bacterium]|nr:DUF3380 domain-containing protein [Flavobacteriales bacterium]